MNRDVWLIDTTLRDGEQMPGAAFSMRDRLRIAALLTEAGVPEIEAGIPSMGEGEIACIKAVSGVSSSIRVTCWCRAVPGDIRAAALCETGSVHIAFPVSDIQLEAAGISRIKLLDILNDLLKEAHRSFDNISVGAQDASRADPELLVDFSRSALAAGACRIRIADTVGILSPLRTWRLISCLRESVPGAVFEFHGHNDFGMAAANTVTAIQSGAACASVTIGGIGERAGNAPLEEVAASLAILEGVETGIDLKALSGLSEAISDITGIHLCRNRPITGELAFTHESGIHVDGLLKDSSSFEPFPPEMVGRSRKFSLGRHSGSRAIEHALKDGAYPVTRAEARLILPLIRDLAPLLGGSVPAEVAGCLVAWLLDTGIIPSRNSSAA